MLVLLQTIYIHCFISCLYAYGFFKFINYYPSIIIYRKIDYINAHATSTPQGDMYEAKALNTLFAGTKALISSTKGMTGHECWMAGASEAVYCILMMQNGFIAPNLNFEEPDEYSAGLNLVTRTTQKKMDVVLSNSFGFGGTNSALVLKRFDEDLDYGFENSSCQK